MKRRYRGGTAAPSYMADRQVAEHVKVGTCGFAMKQQEYYATFPVVEIQQTFYKVPRVSTGVRWRAGSAAT